VIVTLVRVVKGGQDVLCLLNGHMVMSADPAIGDDADAVITVAYNLVDILGADLVEVEYRAEREAWTCSDILETLKPPASLAQQAALAEVLGQQESAWGTPECAMK
jgi:hypothetical protein